MESQAAPPPVVTASVAPMIDIPAPPVEPDIAPLTLADVTSPAAPPQPAADPLPPAAEVAASPAVTEATPAPPVAEPAPPAPVVVAEVASPADPAATGTTSTVASDEIAAMTSATAMPRGTKDSPAAAITPDAGHAEPLPDPSVVASLPTPLEPAPLPKVVPRVRPAAESPPSTSFSLSLQPSQLVGWGHVGDVAVVPGVVPGLARFASTQIPPLPASSLTLPNPGPMFVQPAAKPRPKPRSTARPASATAALSGPATTSPGDPIDLRALMDHPIEPPRPRAVKPRPRAKAELPSSALPIRTTPRAP